MHLLKGMRQAADFIPGRGPGQGRVQVPLGNGGRRPFQEPDGAGDLPGNEHRHQDQKEQSGQADGHQPLAQAIEARKELIFGDDDPHGETADRERGKIQPGCLVVDKIPDPDKTFFTRFHFLADLPQFGIVGKRGHKINILVHAPLLLGHGDKHPLPGEEKGIAVIENFGRGHNILQPRQVDAGGHHSLQDLLALLVPVKRDGVGDHDGVAGGLLIRLAPQSPVELLGNFVPSPVEVVVPATPQITLLDGPALPIHVR